MSGRILVLLFLLLGALYTSAQTASDLQLAQYYYNNSELDKAVGYFEKVYAQDQSKTIFLPYYECLLAQKDFKTAEKLLRKQIALNKQDYEVRLMAGQFYEEQNDPAKAKKIFEELLAYIGPNPGQAISIYQAFASKGKFEYAKRALDSGQKMSPNYPFNFHYADY